MAYGTEDPREQLALAIESQKRLAFRDLRTSDVQALGTLISRWSEWDAETLVRVFCTALDDANWFDLAIAIRSLPAVQKLYAEWTAREIEAVNEP